MRGEDQSKETQGQRGARRCREVLHAHLVFVSAVAIKILPHGHITRLALVDDRGGVQRRAALPIARGSRVACSTRGPNAWHQQTEQTADGDDSRGSRRRGQTALGSATFEGVVGSILPKCGTGIRHRALTEETAADN